MAVEGYIAEVRLEPRPQTIGRVWRRHKEDHGALQTVAATEVLRW
jgi:hypothetical protein